MSKKVPKTSTGRPPKDPSLRRDQDIRIPVTAQEKEQIQSAVENGELASWARSVLLEAAKKRHK